MRFLNIIGMPILIVSFYSIIVTIIFYLGIIDTPESFGDWMYLVIIKIPLLIGLLSIVFYGPVFLCNYSKYPRITAIFGIIGVIFIYYNMLTMEVSPPNPELLEMGVSVGGNTTIKLWRGLVDIVFSIGCIIGFFHKK
jgi:hypothetical protein